MTTTPADDNTGPDKGSSERERLMELLHAAAHTVTADRRSLILRPEYAVQLIQSAGFGDVAALRAERDHWKAAHDNQRDIKRAALVRADLPVPEHPERTEFRATMRRLEDDRDAALAESKRMREALNEIARLDAYDYGSSDRMNRRVTKIVSIARRALAASAAAPAPAAATAEGAGDGWISTADRVPDDGCDVLIYRKECVYTARFQDGTGDGNDCWQTGGSRYWPGEVKFWRPLPHPPAAQQQQEGGA